MDELIEFILELLLEGSIELSSNRKVPKYIRYPLIFLITLFLLVVIIGIFIIGILLIDENVLVGLLFIVLSIIFEIGSIKKFKKLYLQKKNEKSDES